MNQIKTIFDAASVMDGTHAELCEIYDALQVLDDSMEEEGYQPEGKFEDWKAINFARRYPVYQSTFRVICRDLARIIDELKTNADSMYADSRKEANA